MIRARSPQAHELAWLPIGAARTWLFALGDEAQALPIPSGAARTWLTLGLVAGSLITLSGAATYTWIKVSKVLVKDVSGAGDPPPTAG